MNLFFVVIVSFNFIMTLQLYLFASKNYIKPLILNRNWQLEFLVMILQVLEETVRSIRNKTKQHHQQKTQNPYFPHFPKLIWDKY